MKAFDGFLKNRKEGFTQIALITGIAVVACLLANELVWRADLTEDNRYTLSPASEQIAENIDDPITVTAFFSSDLPPEMELVKEEFRNLIVEFQALSGGNVEYEFVNPNEDEEAEIRAQQEEIQPLYVNVRERDQVSQKRAYLGAVFRYSNKKEVLPVIRRGSSIEYEIALNFKKLIATQKPRIGFLTGHGEPPQTAMNQVMDELEELYQVVPVGSIDSTSVPANLEALIVINPMQELSTRELLEIDQFIMRGGKVFFALNRVQDNLQVGTGQPINTGLEELLAAYNLPVQLNLVQDVNSSEIQIQSRQGVFNVVNRVRYPFFPIVSNFSNHPISSGLEAMVFPFVSSVDITKADTSRQQVYGLAFSSEQSDTTGNIFNLDPNNRQWTPEDFSRSSIPMAAAIEGTFQSVFADNDTLDVPLKQSSNTALVVVGDGDFVVNGTGQQQQQLPEDNVSFFVNSIDWLADDTGLVTLRTKRVTHRPLAQIEDSTKTILKYGNVLFPILLVAGYGLYRYKRSQSRRRQWKEEGV